MSYRIISNSFMTEVLSYKNQSIGLPSKSMGGFLYDRDHRFERLKILSSI